MKAVNELSVAIIDDDPLYTEHLEGFLRRVGIENITSYDASENEHADLAAISADCVLIDYDLGDDNGFDVAARLRKEHPNPPPAVLMTAMGGESTAVKALRGGFADYVSKRGFSTSELIGAISRAVAQASGDELEARAPEVETDPTTGLPLVAHTRATLQRFAEASGEHTFRLMLVECLRLRATREEQGLAAADRLTAAMAAALVRCIGPNTFLGHWTEHRFAILSDVDTSAEEVERWCRNAATRLRREVMHDGVRLRLEETIGCVVRRSGDQPADAIARDAERALVEANRQGRSFVVDARTASPAMESAEAAKPAAPAARRSRKPARRKVKEVADA